MLNAAYLTKQGFAPIQLTAEAIQRELPGVREFAFGNFVVERPHLGVSGFDIRLCDDRPLAQQLQAYSATHAKERLIAHIKVAPTPEAARELDMQLREYAASSPLKDGP